MATQTILWILLAAFVALGLSLFQYYFRGGKKHKKWPWFTLLRFFAWFGLFLLLINPKFTQKSYFLEKPSLVVVVDNSSSIANFGKGKEVKNFVSKLQNNAKVVERFDLEIYSFGENLQAGDSLRFSEGQTKIGEALQKAQQIYKGKTAPLVLVTDGNQTFGQDYRYIARENDRKIYPVVVGDTAQYVDLKIAQLNVNRYAFLNNKFPVEVFVNYEGTEKSESELLLKQGSNTVFRKSLHFSDEKKSERITAILPAESIGVKTYTAIVQPLAKEKNKTNNRQQFAIEVIDEKTKVLLLAGRLHPDVGALKKSIESNEQRSVTIKTMNEDFSIGEYQLVILYQPNPNFKQVFEQLETLKINSFTIAGTATDYGFLNSVQTDFQKKSSHQTEEYLPKFNENYATFQLENIGFDDFPPLKDNFGTIDFKKTFHPLLYQKIQGLETETPLLATLEQQDGRRKAYLFGEGIWKWRAKNYLDAHSFEDFDEFMGKLVQYLASTKKRSRLELTHNSFYNKGDELTIEAGYFDKNFVFDPRGTLTLTAKNKDSGERVQRPFLLKNTNYKVNLSDFPPGNYSFTVKVEGQNLSKSGEFTLIDFEVEKQFMNANLEQLQQIATNQNEHVYFLDRAELLVGDLLENEAFKPVQKSRENIVSLIDWYYLLGIVILALSAEWFLRKYHGLV